MIVMGDEVRRTQRGDNNCYCLDNEISWFDWTLAAKHADVHRFLTLLNARRLLREEEPERQHLSLNQVLRKANKAWHGVKLGQPDWSPWSHSLALSAESPKEKVLFHVILNAYWQPLEFELPLPGSHGAGPGGGGSTRPSIHRTTSSNGRRHNQFHHHRIGPGRAL